MSNYLTFLAFYAVISSLIINTLIEIIRERNKQIEMMKVLLLYTIIEIGHKIIHI